MAEVIVFPKTPKEKLQKKQRELWNYKKEKSQLKQNLIFL